MTKKKIHQLIDELDALEAEFEDLEPDGDDEPSVSKVGNSPEPHDDD